MITADNYFNEINRIGNNNLPVTLWKGHEYVVKGTANGTNWDTYHKNATIRSVIDLYFNKLNQFLSTEAGKKMRGSYKTETIKYAPSPKVQKKGTKIKSKSKPKEKVPAPKKSFKKVEHVREEVKFIRRFVRLHNKVKSAVSVLSLIKSLQRSIIQKLIRKTSPLANEIRSIQDKLVQAYNSAKGKDLKIEINEKDLPKLVAIAGGEEVYPSINIMKRYVSLQGKEVDNKKIEAFTKQIESALEKKKVQGDDPYYETVKTIYNTVKKYKAGNTVHIATAELNGLEGIVKACACKKRINQTNHGYEGQNSEPHLNKALSKSSGLNGVLTAEEMANRKLDLLSFTSIWYQLLGSPAKNFTLMLHGEPHYGKTILLLKFAQYLAEKFGRVLFVTSEEFASPSMSKKVKDLLIPFPDRIHFSENLKDPDLSQYDFIFLDSVNHLGVKINDFNEMRTDYPGAAFIFVLQHTKDGNFKGGKDWEHLAEIVGEVIEKGIVEITKNRYAALSKIDFFEQLNIPPLADNSSIPKAYPTNYYSTSDK